MQLGGGGSAPQQCRANAKHPPQPYTSLEGGLSVTLRFHDLTITGPYGPRL